MKSIFEEQMSKILNISKEEVSHRLEKAKITQSPPTKNKLDILYINVPLFIRLLEFAREEAKNDMILHTVTENLLKICSSGKIATMDEYKQIVRG